MANDNLYGDFHRDYEAGSRRISGILTGCAILAVIGFMLAV